MARICLRLRMNLLGLTLVFMTYNSFVGISTFLENRWKIVRENGNGSPNNVTKLSSRRKVNVLEEFNSTNMRLGLPRDNLLNMTPPTFIPGYRNPCWRGEKNETRCLPYFYLSGIQKSGTTDLYARLTRHPHVLSKTKENAWWVRRRFVDPNAGKPGVPFTAYISLFPLESLAKSHEPQVEDWQRYFIIGDGTPGLFWDNTAWRGLAEEQEGRPPLYDEPKDTQHPAYYIRRLQPNAKIIAIARNPVSRTYSGYNYMHRNSSAEHFHLDILNNTKEFRRCTQLRTLRACVCDVFFRKAFETRLTPSLYAVHILEWYKHFPREQILFLRLEDSVEENLRKTFSFLELSELPIKFMTQIINASHKNRQHTEKMFPETWELLEDFYRPFNEHLAAILGDKKYLWSDSVRSTQDISYDEFRRLN